MNPDDIRPELRTLQESVRARLGRAGDSAAVCRVAAWAAREVERIAKRFRSRVSRQQVHPVPHRRLAGGRTAGLWRKVDEALCQARQEIDALVADWQSRYGKGSGVKSQSDARTL